MVSIKIVQLSHQVRKDLTCPVLIRITENRKVKYIKTGYAVKLAQFKEGMDNWVYKHPDASLINLAIEKKRSELMETVITSDIEGKDLDIDALSGKRSRKTFVAAMEAKLNLLRSRDKAAAYHKLSALIKNVKAAWGKDVPLSSLSKDLVNKYITYRVKEKRKINTIKKDLAMMSGILSGIESYTGKNYFHLAQSEFKQEETNKEKLTLEEIKQLEGVKLEGLNEVARDMFLFAFYTHGMRFQNVLMFEEKTIKNGVINYRMNKGKKFREIEVHAKLSDIISKYKGKSLYLFPVLKRKPADNWEVSHLTGSANAEINAHLKRVAIISGVDKPISFHQSRHTFSYLSLKRGVSMEVLKDALGHSNYKTTQAYLKSLSDDDINSAVRGLYD